LIGDECIRRAAAGLAETGGDEARVRQAADQSRQISLLEICFGLARLIG